MRKEGMCWTPMKNENSTPGTMNKMEWLHYMTGCLCVVSYRSGGCFMQLHSLTFECLLHSLSHQQSCWTIVGNLRLDCL